MAKKNQAAKEKDGKPAKGKVGKNNPFRFFTDEHFTFSLGIFFLIASVILILAFISFLFTWEADQNFDWSNIFRSTSNAQNWSAKIGAVLANNFISRGFGLAAFSIPFLLIIFGFRLLKIRLLNTGKTLKYTIYLTLWLSVALSFIMNDAGGYLYSGPGGCYGYFISGWLKSYIGIAGTGLLLAFTLFIFIIVSIASSLEWFKNLFKKKIRPEIPLSETEAQDAELSLADEQEPPFTIEITDNEARAYQPPVTVINEIAGPETEDEPELVSHDEVEMSVEKRQEEVTLPEKLIQEMGKYDPTLDLSNYKMPPIDLLIDHKSENSEVTREELTSNKNKIVETLANYKIQIDKIKATIGPTITLYEIVPAPGIRISKIKNLEDDIALSLSALGIRIIAPIPGKGTIGIEVPNQNPEIVSMRSIISSAKFQESKFELPIALGKTISNETYVLDLTRLPHLLVAGATGQGKSVGINAILTSILYKKHPSEVKFVLVDPKKVELTLYSMIEKHYLAKIPGSDEAIITDVRKVVSTLNSLTIEMDSRYDLMKEAQVRNIKEYNEKFTARRLNPEKGHHYLPYIVLVIDEFADLIMTAGKEIEAPIARIAQLARAVGIHLIIATQRPSINIITGIIKANFPARMAFKVSSMIDSRTILDSPGANQLVGRGDMLISQSNEMVRIQCAFVNIDELEALSKFIGSQQGYPSAFLLPEPYDENAGDERELDLDKRDELFEEAARLVVIHQQGSTSLIQRKFSIGYNRAGRIIDQLYAAGIVGPNEGSKARQVLFTDEYGLEQYLNSISK
ncbi:MAG: DNA translocase FtsK 4TM domain-containing protein [Bacteroidia bacterium]|nr:DNA translocase FtsK 4TM domain-containing protein [Bacteroidia bacterium]